jgi:hypothetical protein
MDVSAQMGLLFHSTTPGLSAATISKMPLKPPRPSSTDSTGVAIPNADRVLTPLPWNWSANIHGSQNRVASAASSSARTYAVALAASDGRFERALAPGCVEDRGETFGPMHPRASHAVGSSVTDTLVDVSFPDDASMAAKTFPTSSGYTRQQCQSLKNQRARY